MPIQDANGRVRDRSIGVINQMGGCYATQKSHPLRALRTVRSRQ